MTDLEELLRTVEKMELSYRKEYTDHPIFLAMAYFYTNHLTVEAEMGDTPEEAVELVAQKVDKAKAEMYRGVR